MALPDTVESVCKSGRILMAQRRRVGVPVLSSLLTSGFDPLLAVMQFLSDVGLGAFEAAVKAGTGVSGLGVIFVYSVLIAFILPLPSELVLCPVGYVCPGSSLGLAPLPPEVQVVLVVITSASGKALGSILALIVGHNASHSGPVIRALRWMGFSPMEWSKRQMISVVKRWGYVGMAVALSVPFFPDTVSIYAFSVIESDYRKFALAAFAGSVGRLLITIGLIEGALLVL